MSTESVAAACALVMSLVPAPPPTPQCEPRLAIDIVFAGRRLPDATAKAAFREVADIWRKYGVDIRAADRDRPSAAIKLSVMIVRHQDTRVPVEALGSIGFVDDAPAPVIQMYADAIDSLIVGSVLPAYTNRASPLHDAVVGRVLGRALAHEIGHYLLRRRTHSTVGLMRARQTAIELVSPERQTFTLAADDVALLDSIIQTSLASSALPLP